MTITTSVGGSATTNNVPATNASIRKKSRLSGRQSLSGNYSNSELLDGQEEENTDIVVKVIPILEQLGRGENLDKLILEIIRGLDAKTELLQLLTAAKDHVTIYGINDALSVIRNMETNVLMKALENESANCQQRNEIFERLKNETADMRKALKTAQTEHANLEKQIKEIEDKSNEKTDNKAQQNRGNLFGRLFFAQNASDASSSSASNPKLEEQKMAYENSTNLLVQSNMQLGETEIVSSEGMLGNMLLALVGDVGKEMSTILSANKIPSRTTSVEFVTLWKNFPENVPTYIPILQRVSKLGALAFHSFIKSIINSDGEAIRNYLPSSNNLSSTNSPTSISENLTGFPSTDALDSGSKSTSFRLEYLKQHISQHLVCLLSNPVVKELCNFVMDFIMADVLASVLYYAGSQLSMKTRKNNLHEDLINKLISKLPLLSQTAIGDILGQAFEQRRRRKWGILISLVTPRFADETVHALHKAYELATVEEAKTGILNGAKYIRFDIGSPSTIDTHMRWLNSLLLKSKEKDGQHRQQLCVRAMEHTLRSLPLYSNVEKLKGYLDETQSRLDQLGKNLDYLTSPRIRLINTDLLRSNSSINAMRANLEQCIKFKFSNKRISPRYLADLLHFLRGGGSTWDQFSLQLESAEFGDITGHEKKVTLDSHSSSYRPTIDRLEQAYGTARTQLPIEICQLIGQKIFRSNRTYNSKNSVDAEIIHLLCLCMVQMAVHNFPYTSEAINEFIRNPKNGTIERVFIAVYALNFICVPEGLFREHLSRMFDDEALDESFDKIKTLLRPTLELLFVEISKYIPLVKHLLTIGDAIVEFPTNSFTIQDEQQMFNDHVHKLLQLDWNSGDLNMEQVLPDFPDITLDFLIYCLRLAPHINCDSLWEPTPDNCSMSGKFIGKWVLHRDANVRAQVLRTIVRSMKHEELRSDIIQCFITMLSHRDYQSPSCLSMLLKTVTHLMEVFKKEMIVSNENRKTTAGVRGGNDNKDENDVWSPKSQKTRRAANLNTPDVNKDEEKSDEFPEWLQWFPRADGYGLVLLCHYDGHVRYFAYEFLLKLCDIYNTFVGKEEMATAFYSELVRTTSKGLNRAGSTFNGSRTPFPKASLHTAALSAMSTLDKTIGGLIQVHGRTISRIALMKANQENNARNEMGLLLNNTTGAVPSTILESSGPDNERIINGEISTALGSQRMSMTAAGLAMLRNQMRANISKQKDLGFHTVVRMEGLVPSIISQLAKKVVDAHIHETIYAASCFIYHLLGDMPPANCKGKTGWSNGDEWKERSFTRIYWINLHTLLLGLVGEGIPNPFSTTSVKTEELKSNTFENSNGYVFAYQPPGFRGTGGKCFEDTKKDLQKYMKENFWNCLHEESTWLRNVIAEILEGMHWEGIPLILNTLIDVYNDTQGRRRTRMIEDIVFLLHRLGEVNNFAAGIYHGDKDLVKKMFDFIDSLRAEAFRQDRIEKSRWFETQRDLAESYALFLRGLSRIGAHPSIRHVFWHFPNEGVTQEEIQNNIRQFRKRLRYSKKSMMQNRIEYDKLPHISQTNEETRFKMLIWLLKFSNDVDKGANSLHFEDQDFKTTSDRQRVVSVAVFTALQHLLNMGRVFPSKYLGIEEKTTKPKASKKEKLKLKTNLLRGQDNYV
ncbi:hypothetical protein RFI_05119 [Reticulomyxa filosa]|uniref:Uncharacterized protein n=1 Tax=Reticulomyxa filosa TaxID=46433 RepID=X6P1Q8_RETFI|nr:hypothetical protein RFI_05119 [Reticulomyxa filosa]|eukprot:ETO31999.1 hypothetical protein RFI_05119 [Reticulomyxa filosa]